MTIVHAIFDAFGGPTGLANAIGEPLSTVHAWKSAKGGIPSWRRRDVLDAQAKATTPLSTDAIAYLNSTQRGSRLRPTEHPAALGDEARAA